MPHPTTEETSTTTFSLQAYDPEPKHKYPWDWYPASFESSEEALRADAERMKKIGMTMRLVKTVTTYTPL